MYADLTRKNRYINQLRKINRLLPQKWYQFYWIICWFQITSFTFWT